MKYIRIGNNVEITWNITRYNLEENLSNKDVKVFLIDKNKHRQIFDYSIKGNQIKGIFYGKNQVCIGTYRLVLIENDGKDDMVTLDYIDVFVLSQKLKNSTSTGEDANPNYSTEVVEISSNINTGDFGKIATKDYVKEVVQDAVLGDIDLSDYYKKDEVDEQLTQTISYVDNTFIKEHQSLEGLATEDYVDEAISKIQVGDDVDLSGYAKKSDIPTKVSDLTNDSGFINSIPSTYAKKTDLFSKDYNDLTNKPTIPSLSGYAKKTDIPTNISAFNNDKGYLTQHQSLTNYATKTWVEDKGYLTAHQSLTSYAKKSELFSKDYKDLINTPNLSVYATKTELGEVENKIPSITGLATETFVTSKIAEASLGGSEVDLSGYAKLTDIPDTSKFITEHQDISNLATKDELFSGSYEDLTNKPTIPSIDGLMKESDADNKYQPKGSYLTSVPSNYALKTDIPSLAGYALKTDIPDVSKHITMSDVESKGYLTEHQDISGKADVGHKHSEYLTSIPNTYALKTDIPSLDNCVKKTDSITLKGVKEDGTEITFTIYGGE